MPGISAPGRTSTAFSAAGLAGPELAAASLVAQDPDAIGTTAATRLFARINGDTTPARELILRTRFIFRSSEEVSPR